MAHSGTESGNRRLHGRSAAWLFAAVVVTAGLAACTQPFNTQFNTQVSDDTAPSIVITTPEDGSSYASVVLVEGVVTDTTGDSGAAGLAVSVSYEVLSTSISGSTAVNEDGSFSFSFETEGLSGSITLSVRATDWNGNTREAFLSLANDGAIPSFAASPQNKSVVLSWDDVPLAQSYAVRYAGTGSIPSETSGTLLEDVTSPLTVSGLANGGQYSFLLEARHTSGSSSWSEIEAAIPLSESTLIPTVTAGYRQITIEWPSIEGSDQYEVWRATGAGGTLAPITGARAGTQYVDYAVAAGSRYYYAIRPAAPGAIVSAATGGEPSPFPRDPLDLISSDLGVFNTGFAIAISGNYAFVGSFGSFFSTWADLYVFDISNIVNPSQLGSVRLNGAGGASRITDVEVVSDTVYLTTDKGRVHIVDVSDPAAPVESAVPNGFTMTKAIAFDGGFAYVADEAGGLRRVPAATLDLGDASARDYTTTDSVYDVVVAGGYAYIAAGSAGLEIIDLATFTMADSVPIAGANATSVALDGGYAYVGLGDSGATNGLAVVDVSTVGSASVTGTADTGLEALDVDVFSGRAYLSNGTAGLSIVDVNDPANPDLVVAGSTGDDSRRATFSGSRLFTVGSSGTLLSVYRVNAYPQPAAGGVVATGAGSLRAVVNGVIVTTNADVVELYDLETGAMIDSYPLPTDYQFARATVHGNLVLYTSIDSTAFDVGRLDILRITSSSDVAHVGSKAIDNLIFSVAAEGDLAYVGGFNSLLVLDISDPSQPEVVGVEAIPDAIVGLAKRGNMIYALTSAMLVDDNKLVAVDVSLPRSPRAGVSLSIPDMPNWVGVRGDSIFVALDTNSSVEDLQIIDISDPASPVLGAVLDLSGTRVDGATIEGSYLYAVTGSSLEVLEVSDPSDPVTIGRWAVSADPVVVVSGDRVLFSNASNVNRATLAGM